MPVGVISKTFGTNAMNRYKVFLANGNELEIEAEAWLLDACDCKIRTVEFRAKGETVAVFGFTSILGVANAAHCK